MRYRYNYHPKNLRRRAVGMNDGRHPVDVISQTERVRLKKSSLAELYTVARKSYEKLRRRRKTYKILTDQYRGTISPISARIALALGFVTGFAALVGALLWLPRWSDTINITLSLIIMSVAAVLAGMLWRQLCVKINFGSLKHRAKIEVCEEYCPAIMELVEYDCSAKVELGQRQDEIAKMEKEFPNEAISVPAGDHLVTLERAKTIRWHTSYEDMPPKRDLVEFVTIVRSSEAMKMAEATANEDYVTDEIKMPASEEPEELTEEIKVPVAKAVEEVLAKDIEAPAEEPKVETTDGSEAEATDEPEAEAADESKPLTKDEVLTTIGATTNRLRTKEEILKELLRGLEAISQG